MQDLGYGGVDDAAVGEVVGAEQGAGGGDDALDEVGTEVGVVDGEVGEGGDERGEQAGVLGHDPLLGGGAEGMAGEHDEGGVSAVGEHAQLGADERGDAVGGGAVAPDLGVELGDPARQLVLDHGGDEVVPRAEVLVEAGPRQADLRGEGGQGEGVGPLLGDQHPGRFEQRPQPLRTVFGDGGGADLRHADESTGVLPTSRRKPLRRFVTTLPAIAGGLLTPTAGTVHPNESPLYVNGKVDRKAAGDTAYVLQASSLIAFLTVMDNLLVRDVIRGKQPDWKRLENCSKRWFCRPRPVVTRRSCPAGNGSARQWRRRSTRRRPVILADEPTAALDRERGRAVMALLAAHAHGRNAVVLVCTHDERALDLADRTLRIEDGRLG